VARGQYTVLAIGASRNINDESPFFQALARRACCHLSSWTRQEFGAMPSAVADIVRAGVSRFRHPPRSTGPCSVSTSSYSAQDSYARTTPERTRGDTAAAQITA